MSSSSRATTSESRTVDDKFVTHNLDKPTPTVEWLPDGEEPEGKLTIQKLIVGTCAPENEQSILMHDQVKLSREDWVGEESSSSVEIGMTRRVQKINHDGVVNWARYMPQNPSTIATKTGSAEFFIFDCTKHPSKPPEEGVCNPDLRLTGHKDKGHCLSWSPFKKGHLLSGSEDGQVCLWDVNATPTDKTLEAMRIFDIQHGCIEDVAWHMKDGNLFGTVGEDKRLHIWDICTPAINLNQSVLCHDAKVNSLAFCGPIVATGSSDRKVKVFDLRKTSPFLHTLECPLQEEAGHVRWNHKHENYLASSSGRKIIVWDISRMGHSQTSEEANRGPPEFVFFHSAHTDSITDFSWSPTYDLAIASVAKDNNLEISNRGADHCCKRERNKIGFTESNQLIQEIRTITNPPQEEVPQVLQEQEGNVDGEEQIDLDEENTIPVVIRHEGMDEVVANIVVQVGFSTFAETVYNCYDHQGQDQIIPHILWPWPEFRATYVHLNGEEEVPINPLNFGWENFRELLNKIVMQRHNDGPRIYIDADGDDERLLYILRDYLVNDRVVFYRIMQLSICSYINLEPMEFMEGMENNNTIEVGGLRARFWDMEGEELLLTDEWHTFELELESITLELVIE